MNKYIFLFAVLSFSNLGFAQNVDQDTQAIRNRLGRLPIARGEIGALQKFKSNGFTESYYKAPGVEEKPYFLFWAEPNATEKNIVKLVFPHGSFNSEKTVVRYFIRPEVYVAMKYFTQLKEVNFDGTTLNDDALINHVATIGSLRLINVANTEVTQSGIDKAKAINPNLNFDFQSINAYPFFWQRRYIDHLHQLGVKTTHSFKPWLATELDTAVRSRPCGGLTTGMWINTQWRGLQYSQNHIQQNQHCGITSVVVTDNAQALLGDFQFLENNTKLMMFHGNHLVFTNEIIHILRHNAGLRGLYLSGNFITNDGIDEIIKSFPDLQYLYIESNAITQEKALELLQLKELKSLILPSMDFSYENLAKIIKDGRVFEAFVFRSIQTINNAPQDYAVLKSINAHSFGVSGMPPTQVENLFKVQNVKFIFVSSKTTEAVLQALWEAKVKTRTSVYVQAVDYPFEQK